jgi:hypothetical protein
MNYFVLIINIVSNCLVLAGIVASIILLSKKELKPSVTTLIMVFALWTALIVASLTIAQEIENARGNPTYGDFEENLNEVP